MDLIDLFENLEPEIIDQICYEVGDCDKCPVYVSKHCKAEEAEEGDEDNGVL